MKNFLIKTYVLIALNFILSTSFANTLYDTEHSVTLSGFLQEKQYFDANDVLEKCIILKINSQIDVKKDELGELAKNVTQIQLIFPYNTNVSKIKINKKISVTGMLFHPISAHHHTKVLLYVKSFKYP
jgi:hypothetical protein